MVYPGFLIRGRGRIWPERAVDAVLIEKLCHEKCSESQSIRINYTSTL